MGRFTNPRDLYFGEGARHEVKNLKGKKAIIVSGGSSMRRGGFLQDVEADLKEGGFEVKLFEGVESDPSIETVMKGAESVSLVRVPLSFTVQPMSPAASSVTLMRFLPATAKSCESFSLLPVRVFRSSMPSVILPRMTRR